jgi:hypothetical protein
VGEQRFSARDLHAALPPGWAELASEMPAGSWDLRHLSGKSSQTLALGLLGVAAHRDPSLRWLFEALRLPRPRDAVMEFEHTVGPDLLGERARRTTVDVLVRDPGVVLCIDASWREGGMRTCPCRAGPGEGERCSAGIEARNAYWETAREVFGIRRRGDGAPCPISAPFAAVRNVAAARALAGADRLAVLALVHDADNPYFAGCGDWPGWPAALRAAVERRADPRRFRFAAISWQELVPSLPLDDSTRDWAREKHRLG